MNDLLDPIYLITDRHAVPEGRFLETLEACLSGGVRLIQFREKDLSPRARYELGLEVMALAARFSAHVIVNGDPALALALGAAGVQLGKDTLPVAAVRARLAFEGLIGYSAHGEEEAAEAFAEGADFITLSPVFPTRSKFSRGPHLGLARFGETARKLPGPVYALGGLGPESAAECRAAGAGGLALIGALLGAEDPAAAARDLRERWGD
ncbi:MAG: thiamine phosphate synthase [bacterium]|nr:thiamine phosphate synthase [bacterium]